MEIEVVFPMAGIGQRFKNFTSISKPLYEVVGIPIFLWSLLSLKEIWKISRFTFVIHTEDKIRKRIEETLSFLNLNFQIIEIQNRTNGPAWTLYKSKFFINSELPLISMDCDLFFESKIFFKFVSEGNNNFGMLSYFDSSSDRYSFVTLDNSNKVIKIAEKILISNNAVIGCYFFPYAKDVFNQINKYPQNENTELPISKILQDLIDSGTEFRTFKNDKYFSFGTPEEIENIKDLLELKKLGDQFKIFQTKT